VPSASGNSYRLRVRFFVIRLEGIDAAVFLFKALISLCSSQKRRHCVFITISRSSARSRRVFQHRIKCEHDFPNKAVLMCRGGDD